MFQVSVSKANSFFTCMAQYDYGRKLEPLDKNAFLDDGTAAHQLLAGVAPDKLSVRARSFYEQLKLLYDSKGYKPLWTENGKPVVERRQEFMLTDNIRLVRVVDAFATVDGEATLIDWKTAVYPWREVANAANPLEHGVTPQSMGFQAAAYLIPSTDNVPFHWPARIDFLVASERGGMGIHTYRYNEEDIKNFIASAEIMRKAKTFPKHRGGHCAFCVFNQACYNLPNWQSLYKEKKGSKHGKNK